MTLIVFQKHSNQMIGRPNPVGGMWVSHLKLRSISRHLKSINMIGTIGLIGCHFFPTIWHFTQIIFCNVIMSSMERTKCEPTIFASVPIRPRPFTIFIKTTHYGKISFGNPITPVSPFQFFQKSWGNPNGGDTILKGKIT